MTNYYLQDKNLINSKMLLFKYAKVMYQSKIDFTITARISSYSDLWPQLAWVRRNGISSILFYI